MAQTISHTEVLNCPVDEVWEACKHADQILPDIVPEYFSKVEFVEGNGGPGTIRVLHLGPAIPQGGTVKERLDAIDEASKTLNYTVVEGDPRYSSFTGEVKFAATADNKTEATWTAKYDPVGDAGAPEHVKEITILMFKTFEKAILAKQTVSHSEKLDASPEAIWSASKKEETLLPKALPQIFESIKYVQGTGEPGSIRACKMGPAIPNGGEVLERVDVVDEVTKKVGFTILKGDPRYKHISATMQYTPGPTAGTTTATWCATFVPAGDFGPPESTIAVQVWKALEAAAKA